jgi:hypothetical protein
MGSDRRITSSRAWATKQHPISEEERGKKSNISNVSLSYELFY